MNKEKLIEKMREAISNNISAFYGTGMGLHINGKDEAAEACAEAALKELDNEWVRVSDRQPENTGSYLCITNDKKWVVATVATNGWWTISPDGKYYGDMGNKVTVNGKLIDREVTHWCNLPSPPKDK